MANQSPDRREVLAMLAKVAAIGQFTGFCRWACAGEHSHNQPTSARPATYQPLFFLPSEYKTVDQLSELIIPKDESPGARDAGVVEFIDFMVAHDDDLQYPFRTGLAWLNAFATEKYAADFSSLAPDQQETLLGKLAYRAQQLPVERQGQEFFALVRKYTVLGYYTSRIGLEELDYPGLQLYSASPECPHKDDPEHKHLPAPRF
jgi:gluconate 2-dehydrogenase gamma chain